MKPPRRDVPRGRKDLHLSELLDFRPDQGIIRLHDQRVVILTAAMGLLRKELIHHYGKISAPVCWSLVGYASGFVSACLGTEVYFRELSCVGQGERHCRAIGRDAASWGAELDVIRADFQAATVGHEVEHLHEAVRRRARELDRRERLLERRERELNLLRERTTRHAADLRGAVDAGTFREDLYFRLAAFIITVPPLPDRRADIPPLVHHFLVRAASRMKKDVCSVSAEAMTALMNYRWPGNVRELEHAVERAVILANNPNVRVPDALKISTVTLWRKMKQYGMAS